LKLFISFTLTLALLLQGKFSGEGIPCYFLRPSVSNRIKLSASTSSPPWDVEALSLMAAVFNILSFKRHCPNHAFLMCRIRGDHIP